MCLSGLGNTEVVMLHVRNGVCLFYGQEYVRKPVSQVAS